MTSRAGAHATGFSRRIVGLIVLVAADAGVLGAGVSAVASHDGGRNARVAASLAEAISQVVHTAGTLTCDIPGDLHSGRVFACSGDDAEGPYSVQVTIVDRNDDFHFVVSRSSPPPGG